MNPRIRPSFSFLTIGTFAALLYLGGSVGCGNNGNSGNQCGNGTLEVGEQCDDGNTIDGDGCSSACTDESPGAAECGNNTVEAGETCDGNCPTSCPQIGCDLFALEGADCTRECVSDGVQTSCVGGDNCCPGNCNETTDNDCNPVCDNGVLESGETCDPVSLCQTQSNACVGDPGNLRTPSGNVGDCTFVCTVTPRPCQNSDSFCPLGCTAINDNDCAGCGNGVVEPGLGETCDPPGTCPVSGSCNSDANFIRIYSGDPSTCNALCTVTPRPCQTGDGFCPAGCTPVNDNECPGCGNGTVEPGLGETCDPPGTCPVSGSCNSDADFIRTYSGNPSTCNARCTAAPRPCQADGFCPTACTAINDPDC